MKMNKETKDMWNKAVEYLKKSRYAWWNKDYIEFLIEKVWKVTEPVSIIDFGCGIGFLGELLLPLLPKGSSYTGVDIGDSLLEEAKARFKDTDYITDFIHADLCHFESEKKYDMAICQAVLQHIPDPLPILAKMKDCVVKDGLVVCMDISRDMCSSSLYIDGFDYSDINLLGIEQKLRHNILKDVHKDFEIGLKMPVFMSKVGLKDIDTRLNDYVQYFDPEDEDYLEQYNAFMTGQYEKRLTENEKDQFVANLTNKGLTPEEAEHLFYGQQKLISYLHDNAGQISLVSSKCMLISYGYNR